MLTGLLAQHRFIAAMLMLLAILTSFSPGWHSLECRVLALYQRVLPSRSIATDVVVVGIDEPTLKDRGSWPWPRDRLAALIKKMDKAGAAAIGIVLPLDRPQPVPDALSRNAAHAGVMPDRLLAKAIADSGHVVIAQGRLTEQGAALNGHVPATGWASSGIVRWLTRFPVITYPEHAGILPVYSASAAATAWISQPGMATVATVSEPLVVPAHETGKWLPGLAVQLYALHEKLATKEIAVEYPLAVQLAFQHVDTDGLLQIYPYPRAGDHEIQTISAASLLAGTTTPSVLAGKTVLLGLTAPGLAETFTGPAGQSWSQVAWQARILEALEYPQLRLTVPAWSYGLQRALLMVMGLVLIMMPPFMLRPGAWIGSLVVAFILANISLSLLLVRSLWLPLAMPALFLLLAHLLLVFRQQIVMKAEALLGRAEQAYCELAANLQGQGQLDRAFDSLMQVRPGMVPAEALYGLGMDFERRRQFVKALRVYDRIAERDRHFRDVAERRRQLSAIPEVFPATAHNINTAVPATMVIDSNSLARPVIGRYEIESVIGQGAMGVVYLGRDPKIGRTVAIKTLSLTSEFEGGQLQEVRRRFYQEAETAGKLHHPDIVTIYDVGEEHDLAYIAMDYVSGGSLKSYIGKDALLPVEEVLAVGVRVAEALDYAHRHQVVHRDIKPENIMYDREQGSVKVTDFGIACLTDNSKTRSGTVLGSPFYMSPEQISGRRVDGRSDLYSLGVTLFHLLTGELPFTGESLASLMYKITHDRPPGVGRVRKGLPSCVTRVVSRALGKKLDRRFDSGSDMAEALRRCAGKCAGDA